MLHCLSVDDLAAVNDVIAESRIDLTTIGQTHESVEICFEKAVRERAKQTRNYILWKRFEVPILDGVITVRQVNEVAMHDTEGIGIYEVDRLAFVPNGLLRFSGPVPFVLDLHVRGIDLDVVIALPGEKRGRSTLLLGGLIEKGP